jgi:hypothetical protein
MGEAANGPGVRFARWVFLVAGVWGVLVLTPMYFLYDFKTGHTPTGTSSPDIYFGFASVTLAWQVLFFFLSTNPPRYRPMIIPCLLEKFGYVATLALLFLKGSAAPTLLPFAAADLVLGVLFATAFVKLRAIKPRVEAAVH